MMAIKTRKKILISILTSFLIMSMPVLSTNAVTDMPDITRGGYAFFTSGNTGGGGSSPPSYMTNDVTYDRETAINRHNTDLLSQMDDKYKTIVRNNSTGREFVYFPTDDFSNRYSNPSFVVQYIDVPYNDLRAFVNFGNTGNEDGVVHTTPLTTIGTSAWNGNDPIIRSNDYTDYLSGMGFLGGYTDTEDNNTVFAFSDNTQIESIRTAKNKIMNDTITNRQYGNSGVPRSLSYPQLTLDNHNFNDTFPGFRWELPNGSIIDGTGGTTGSITISDPSLINRTNDFLTYLNTPSNRKTALFARNTTNGYVEGNNDRDMSTRYRNLTTYLNLFHDLHASAENEKVGTYRVLQYRITDLETDHIMNTEANNDFLWHIYNSSAQPVFTTNTVTGNLTVQFNRSGTYSINLERSYTETHSEYAKYYVDEFWIAADTGQLLWKSTSEEHDVNYNPDTSLTSINYYPVESYLQRVNDIYNYNHVWLNYSDRIRVAAQTERIS